MPSASARCRGPSRELAAVGPRCPCQPHRKRLQRHGWLVGHQARKLPCEPAGRLGTDLHRPRRPVPNRHHRMQHVQNANGAGLCQTDRSPHQAAGVGLRADARSHRRGAFRRQGVGRIMKVRVKLFAVARELTGADEIIVDLPSGATVERLARSRSRRPPRAQTNPSTRTVGRRHRIRNCTTHRCTNNPK